MTDDNPLATLDFSGHAVRDYYDLDPLDPDVRPDVGSDFHEATKLHPALAAFVPGPAPQLWQAGHLTADDEGLATRRWYTTPQALPAPMPVERSLSHVVRERVSTSPPGRNRLGAAELSSVLALSYGATPVPHDGRLHRRPVPSGGALYALDVYLGVNRGGVEGVDAGLYHYDPFEHCLEQLSGAERWDDVAAAGPTPEVVQGSAVMVMLVACFARQCAKYGVRGYRFAYLEAGHVGQSLALAASGLDLRCLPIAAVYDAAVEEALDLDGVHESLVHCVLLGR